MSDSLASQSDAELLKGFSKTRCERVFEELVSRYGRLGMAICLRTLRDQHDAEDVFQATFLVLAEKSGSIRKRDSLPSWLNGETGTETDGETGTGLVLGLYEVE